jgi:hypothetical protein
MNVGMRAGYTTRRTDRAARAIGYDASVPRRERSAPRPRRAATPQSAAAPSTAAAPAALMVALGLAFALRLVASALPPSGLWGLDTLRHVPVAALVAILVVAAAGFVPRIAQMIERALDAVGATWERMGAWADLMVAAASGLALFALEDTTRFTGDFEPRLAQLMAHTPFERMFPQAAVLDRLLNMALARFVMSLGLLAAPALQIVGAAVGALFTFAALAFVRAAGASRGMIPAATAVFLGGGFMLHFAGYDKFGPQLLGVAVAAYGVARLARDGGGAWALALGVAVCLLSHRTSYVLLPAAALPLFQAWRHATPAGRTRLMSAGLLIAAVALAILPATLHLYVSLDRPVQQGLAPAGGEGMAATLARARDGLNVAFLLAPLWLAGVVAAWLAWRARGGEATSPGAAPTRRFSLLPTALAAIGAQWYLVFATRGAQGAFRDWDMFTAAGVVATLAATGALIAAWRRRGSGRALAPAVTTACATAFALWIIHTQPAVALARIDDALRDRSQWNDAAWARAQDYVGLRALREHRAEDAIRAFWAAIQVAPNPRYLFELGLAEREAGNPIHARKAFEKAVARNRLFPDAWMGIGISAYDAGDYARAVACFDSALLIAPQRTDIQDLRGKALDARDAGQP